VAIYLVADPPLRAGEEERLVSGLRLEDLVDDE